MRGAADGRHRGARGSSAVTHTLAVPDGRRVTQSALRLPVATGFSRDDVGRILTAYLAEGILKQDPFATLDQQGVGQLIKMAVAKGRATRPTIKIGICGEHGGDPASVERSE